MSFSWSDGGKHQVHVVTRGTDDRFRASTDTDPGLKLSLGDRQIDALMFQWLICGGLSDDGMSGSSGAALLRLLP